MRFVKVVNRSPKKLNVTWNGIHQQLGPGEHTLPEQLALAFRFQNPIRGSEDQLTGELQYYVGIVDEPYNDPIDPVDESKEIELFNFKKLREAQPVVVIDSSGLYRVRRDDIGAKISNDNPGFVSNKGTERG